MLNSEIIKTNIENRNLSHSLELLDEIFKFYNLSLYLEKFKENNLNSHIFYNNQNIFSMVLNCYEGAVIHELGPNKIRILLVAALFCNFKSKTKIDQNLTTVKKGLVGLNNTHVLLTKNVKLKDEYILEVNDLIKSTKAPFSKKILTCISQKILRDASKMIVYESNEIKVKFYLNLFLHKSIGVKTYLNQCSINLNTVIWDSHWGYVKALKRNYPNECKNLIKDLTVTLNEYS